MKMRAAAINKLIISRLQISAIMFIMMVSILLFWNPKNAYAATVTIAVEANIVPTVNVLAQNGIVFGDISTSAIPGTVNIETSGARTTTGGTKVNTSTAGSPAQFEISGNPNASYNVTLPTSVVIISAAGDSMTVSNFNSNPPTSGQMDANGTLNINIGGRLSVGGFQPVGSYTGVMSATVEHN